MAKTSLAAFALSAAIASGPALATETVVCSGTDDPDVVVEMNLGRGLPADRPNRVRASDGKEDWSTLADEGATPVSLYQSFDDGRSFSIDLTGETVLVSIRIPVARQGEQVLRVGYLQVAGRSLHPIHCDFGDTE